MAKKKTQTMNETTFNEHKADAPVVEAPAPPGLDIIGRKNGVTYLTGKAGVFCLNPNHGGRLERMGSKFSPELLASLKK